MEVASFWRFLPRLSMLILASNTALTSTTQHCFLVDRWFHTYRRVEATSHTTGNSIAGSNSRDSSRILLGEMFCWTEVRLLKRVWPTRLDEGQLNMWRRSSWGWWHSLQQLSWFCRSLLILLWVGSKLWRSLHKKEIWSDSRPRNLASRQEFSQSLCGCWFSALHLMRLLRPLSSTSMVKLSSSSTLYQSLEDILELLRVPCSFTILMVWKKDSE